MTDIMAEDLTSTTTTKKENQTLFYFTISKKYEHVLGLKNEDSF